MAQTLTGSMDQRPKVAIVTGAGSGIGLGIALKFAAEGWNVAVNDISEARARKAAAAIGEAAVPLVGDVSIPSDVADIVDKTVAKWGTLDTMIANAGIPDGAAIIGHDVQLWDRVLAVNLRGPMLCGKYAAKAMIQLKRPGSMVVIGSTLAHVTEDASAAYCASKGGTTLLTRSMAYELGRYGIRVNQVDPGYIRTPVNPLDDEATLSGLLAHIPLGRVGTPEDVAEAVYFLASDAACYVSGASLILDGGLMTSHSIVIDRSEYMHAAVAE